MNSLQWRYEGPSLRNLGRYYQSEERQARMFTFSGSGFEVGFYGTTLSARLIATECGRPQGEAAIAVLVDEQPFENSRKITLDKPDSLYILAAGLTKGRHRVRVYKRTESACSLTGWKSIMTDGEFTSLEPSEGIKIEIYGDSITAGNGVEGVRGDDNFETRTENAILSYGALSAEKLQADFSLVCIGGYPIYKSPWNKGASIESIPQMFSFADCTWSTKKENAIPWDHKRFRPDIVVISLGTNDDQYLLPLAEPERTAECRHFVKATKDFIDLNRKTYEGVKVIVAIGMIPVRLVTDLLKEAVASYPQGVYFLEFDSLKEGGYMPNGGHPNRKMHAEAAEELTALIKKISLAAKG
jgi:GDSL-like Lipase/Acylhydrolase.